jgi:hypothetical protein
VAQVVERLPSKLEAQSSNHTTAKKERKVEARAGKKAGNMARGMHVGGT